MPESNSEDDASAFEIAAIAVDLDGTLLVGDELPDANRGALQRAREKGLKVFIATARWRQMADRINDLVGGDDGLIACNGAQVRVGEVDHVDLRLPDDLTRDLFGIANTHRSVVTATFSESSVIKMAGKLSGPLEVPELAQVDELIPGNDQPRIVTIQGSMAVAAAGELKVKYGEVANFADSIGPSGRVVYTVTHHLAHKGEALHVLCAAAGVRPEQTLVFGDAENDIAMFRAAGMSVAMGQAQASVRAAADHVAPPNDQDGVAVMLARLI